MMLESYSESSLNLNHTDNITVSDKTLIGSIVYHVVERIKRSEREEKHHRSKERKRRQEQA